MPCSADRRGGAGRIAARRLRGGGSRYNGRSASFATSMRLLLVEDDSELADGISQALRQSGYAVDWVADGKRADAALADTEYDSAVLDLGLPGLSGFDVLRRLRERGSRTFVLILTERDEVDNRILGLDLGADDYLTKPFALGELEARLRALNRRVRGDGQIKFCCGGLVLDGLAS